MQLVCGDPSTREAGATFSRFVLPFGYHLAKVPRGSTSEGSPLVYGPARQCPEDWLARTRYFSPEIALVLYRRAKWLRVDPVAWGRQGFVLGGTPGRRVEVVIESPQLVLFEWPTEVGRAADGADDPLHVGMLLVDVHFATSDLLSSGPATLHDLLRVNELFRYHRRPFPKHEKIYAGLFGETFGSSLGAKCVDRGGAIDLYENHWETWLSFPVEAGENLLRLIPETGVNKTAERRKWEAKILKMDARTEPSDGHNAEPVGAVSGWDVYADDRTFVWTSAVLEGGLGALPRVRPGYPSPEEPLRNGLWTKLLNVDRPWSNDYAQLAEQTEFEHRWTDQRTYRRWVHLNSAYGFCYHSGVALLPPSDEPPLTRHFRGMYFDMALLLFYVRVTLFRFSNRLAMLSAAARKHDGSEGWDTESWRQGFATLRKEFAIFANLYQFPLLSNQQQAIEMYEYARKSMDLTELFDELEREIDVSHDCMMQEESHQLGHRALLLTVVGTVGVVLGTICALLGMEVLSKEFANWRWPPLRHWAVFAGSTVLTGLVFLVALRFSRRLERCLRRMMGLGGSDRS